MKRIRGFSLIELAIVLVIVTLLIGGLAVPLTAQIQARRIAETKKILEEAREAVLGFAMTHSADSPPTNRHLPCPDTDGDGQEDRGATGPCISPFGWMPWVTLGTAPQDAWGNRLRYAVNPTFANSAAGFSDTTALSDPLVVCRSNTCSASTPDVADNVVFVLVSHGPNGWGARNINGSTLAAPSGPDEADNLDVDLTFVSRSPTKSDDAAGEFDDLVVWVSRPHLIARVCPTGSDCSPSPSP
jgi:prepilin-type N-terminal cleavage/methylation domain-containing protein